MCLQSDINEKDVIHLVVEGVVASWLVRSTPEQALEIRALAGDMCCVLGQDTLLSRHLSPPRCITGAHTAGGNPTMD